MRETNSELCVKVLKSDPDALWNSEKAKTATKSDQKSLFTERTTRTRRADDTESQESCPRGLPRRFSGPRSGLLPTVKMNGDDEVGPECDDHDGIQENILKYAQWTKNNDQAHWEQLKEKLFPASEWRLMHARKRKNSRESLTTETKNRFAPLCDQNDPNDDITEQKASSSKPKISLKKKATPPKTTKKSPPPKKQVKDIPKQPPKDAEQKKEKLPPVIVEDVDTWLFQKIVKEKNIDVCIKSGRQKHTITAKTQEDLNILRQIVKDSDAGGFTYPTQDEKRTAVVLKGLPAESDRDDLINEIKEKTGHVVEVNRLRTDAAREGKYELNMFVVSGEAKIMKDVTELNCLAYHRIRWEKLLKDDVTRCRKCQRYGHSARGCLYASRCARCNEEHETKDCTAENVAKENAFCVNCGKRGHPASYRGCETRKLILKSVKKRQEEKKIREHETAARRNFGQTSANRIVIPGVSFADMAKTKDHGPRQELSRAPRNVSQPSSFDFITSEVPKLFTCDAGELMNKIHHFLPEYKNAKSLGHKQSMFLNFMFEVCRTE